MGKEKAEKEHKRNRKGKSQLDWTKKKDEVQRYKKRRNTKRE